MEQNASMVSIPKIQISYAAIISVKGIITGILILVMLIPTLFINRKDYNLTQGVPDGAINSTGLWGNVCLTSEELNKESSFEFKLRIKGSKQLHFVPLAGNSSFALQSSWFNPPFEGNTILIKRTVNEKGFTAKSNFNKANLPFNTVIEEFNIEEEALPLE
jgi:inner membrane protein